MRILGWWRNVPRGKEKGVKIQTGDPSKVHLNIVGASVTGKQKTAHSKKNYQ